MHGGYSKLKSVRGLPSAMLMSMLLPVAVFEGMERIGLICI